MFTQPDNEMPPDLLEALYVLDDLADETGHDRILDEAKRQGISLNGDGMTPGEFAIVVHCDHPRLIRVCHEKTIYRKVRNYQEYQAKDNAALSAAKAKTKISELILIAPTRPQQAGPTSCNHLRSSPPTPATATA